jgi:hypothetical protein
MKKLNSVDLIARMFPWTSMQEAVGMAKVFLEEAGDKDKDKIIPGDDRVLYGQEFTVANVQAMFYYYIVKNIVNGTYNHLNDVFKTITDGTTKGKGGEDYVVRDKTELKFVFRSKDYKSGAGDNNSFIERVDAIDDSANGKLSLIFDYEPFGDTDNKSEQYDFDQGYLNSQFEKYANDLMGKMSAGFTSNNKPPPPNTKSIPSNPNAGQGDGEKPKATEQQMNDIKEWSNKDFSDLDSLLEDVPNASEIKGKIQEEFQAILNAGEIPYMVGMTDNTPPLGKDYFATGTMFLETSTEFTKAFGSGDTRFYSYNVDGDWLEFAVYAFKPDAYEIPKGTLGASLTSVPASAPKTPAPESKPQAPTIKPFKSWDESGIKTFVTDLNAAATWLTSKQANWSATPDEKGNYTVEGNLGTKIVIQPKGNKPIVLGFLNGTRVWSDLLSTLTKTPTIFSYRVYTIAWFLSTGKFSTTDGLQKNQLPTDHPLYPKAA